MKKIIIIFFLLITSCSDNTTNSIEGSWIRQGTIEYKNGKPIDTVNFDGIYFEVYSKSSYSLLINEINIDSISGLDTDKGVSEAGRYIFDGNILKKQVFYATGWLDDVINRWKDTDKDYLEVEFKIDLGNNHLSKLSRLDSLGSGFAEYYKRVD
tara:strand:+ start:5017 stop:5478 length:462 start_codon:yes stop_codon:yes gene_type:complete